jgi:hypothetical protein
MAISTLATRQAILGEAGVWTRTGVAKRARQPGRLRRVLVAEGVRS